MIFEKGKAIFFLVRLTELLVGDIDAAPYVFQLETAAQGEAYQFGIQFEFACACTLFFLDASKPCSTLR